MNKRTWNSKRVCEIRKFINWLYNNTDVQLCKSRNELCGDMDGLTDNETQVLLEQYLKWEAL
jgi:hypothetical protein